jgi:hypothetical protein
MVHGAHLFVLSVDMQASLQPVAAVERNGAEFSQSNLAWEAFHGLGVHDVERFFSD